jgi:hypothetical protein
MKYTLALVSLFAVTQTHGNNLPMPQPKMAALLFATYSKLVNNQDSYIQNYLNKMPEKNLGLKELLLAAIFEELKNPTNENEQAKAFHLLKEKQSLTDEQLELDLKKNMPSDFKEKVEELRDSFEFVELSIEMMRDLRQAPAASAEEPAQK